MKYTATAIATLLLACTTYAQSEDIEMRDPSSNHRRGTRVLVQTVELIPGNGVCHIQQPSENWELHTVEVPPGGWSKVSIGLRGIDYAGEGYIVQWGLARLIDPDDEWTCGRYATSPYLMDYVNGFPQPPIPGGLANVRGDVLVLRMYAGDSDHRGWVHLVWQK